MHTAFLFTPVKNLLFLYNEAARINQKASACSPYGVAHGHGKLLMKKKKKRSRLTRKLKCNITCSLWFLIVLGPKWFEARSNGISHTCQRYLLQQKYWYDNKNKIFFPINWKKYLQNKYHLQVSFKSLALESIIPRLHSPANWVTACNIQIQGTSEKQSLKSSLKTLIPGQRNEQFITSRRVHWRRNRILLLLCWEITCSQV